MNPYKSLDKNSFWKSGVADLHPSNILRVWDPKFIIRKRHAIACYGSCFAQHIGKALATRGYNMLITEVPPKNMSSESASHFNYDKFSSRTGNIYTASLLRQWVEWSIDRALVPAEVWIDNGRYYDPFRPTIEPAGFDSYDECVRSRHYCLDCFYKSIVKSEFIVFTLGLTESWANIDGFEYPMCPGTVAGLFDPDKHIFLNQGFSKVQDDLNFTLGLIKRHNPRVKVILTVSPVPLTATYSGSHVLKATMASKSILRSVAGYFENSKRFVDYFPSYEIISSPAYCGYFFESNKRNISKAGVDHVMDVFFHDLYSKYPDLVPGVVDEKNSTSEFEERCDEELLASFGGL